MDLGLRGCLERRSRPRAHPISQGSNLPCTFLHRTINVAPRFVAQPFDGGWIGTVSNSGWHGEVRVARVTQFARTKRAAVVAARRWYDRPEDGRAYAWIPSPYEPGLYRVVLFAGLRPIELEPILEEDEVEPST